MKPQRFQIKVRKKKKKKITKEAMTIQSSENQRYHLEYHILLLTNFYIFSLEYLKSRKLNKTKQNKTKKKKKETKTRKKQKDDQLRGTSVCNIQ